MTRRIFLDPDSDTDDPEDADANTDPIYGREDEQDSASDISSMDPHANTVPATDPPTPDPVSFHSAKVDSDMLSSKPASDVPTILPIRNAPGQSTVVNPSADDITVPTGNLSDHRESGEPPSFSGTNRLFSEQPSPVLPPAEPPPSLKGSKHLSVHHDDESHPIEARTPIRRSSRIRERNQVKANDVFMYATLLAGAINNFFDFTQFRINFPQNRSLTPMAMEPVTHSIGLSKEELEKLREIQLLDRFHRNGSEQPFWDVEQVLSHKASRTVKHIPGQLRQRVYLKKEVCVKVLFATGQTAWLPMHAVRQPRRYATSSVC
jgi:hypothetical protein